MVNVQSVVCDLNKKLETQKIKIRLGEALGDGKCFVCGKAKSKKGFTIHHLWYVFNDITYDKYPHDSDGQLKYYQDLEPVVMKEKERFLYLCNTDHVALERINRYNPEKLLKLIEAFLLTKTNEKHKNFSKMLKDIL